MFKFIFDLITEPLGLPIEWYYEWIILLVIGEMAYRVAYNKVGVLYQSGSISGKSAGSFFHWIIRTFLSIYYNSLTTLINSSYEYAPLYPGFFFKSSSIRCRLSIKIVSSSLTSSFVSLPLFTALSLNNCIASCFKSDTYSFGRGTPSHVLPCVFNKALSNSFPVISRMVLPERQ